MLNLASLLLPFYINVGRQWCLILDRLLTLSECGDRLSKTTQAESSGPFCLESFVYEVYLMNPVKKLKAGYNILSGQKTY